MTDDDLAGPWLLALGALAIGVGAVAAVLRRCHTDTEDAAGPGNGE